MGRSPPPEDAGYVLERTDSIGFIGASSIERLPVEEPIRAIVESFKSQPLRGPS